MSNAMRNLMAGVESFRIHRFVFIGRTRLIISLSHTNFGGKISSQITYSNDLAIRIEYILITT
jgi:hypothetical protein